MRKTQGRRDHLIIEVNNFELLKDFLDDYTDTLQDFKDFKDFS